ncbi:MAG: hypothetical protein JSW50_08825 [Candidatus Latescibacterota bacterium]|nr:MAG: hypothetical protein JSW50_08825 [Candidatus Latescibacterota bacterium]
MSFNIGFFVIALALVLVGYAAYRRTMPPVTGRLRMILTGLRITAFVLLAALLMDPRFVRRADIEIPAEVVALIDRSASMALPAYASATGSPATRFEEAGKASSELQEIVESRGGHYREVYFAGDAWVAGVDSIAPDGQGTDIRRSLETAFKNHEGENIAAFVVFSDGVETERQLVRKPIPPVTVFTIGVGDTTVPEDVRIKDVDYNSVVRAPSRSTIKATIECLGGVFDSPGRVKKIKIRLMENGATLFETDTLVTVAEREIVQDIPVEFPKPGRRQFRLTASVDGFDAEPENNWRDIAIVAEKAGVRVLIVDQLPTWELSFLAGLLRRDDTFEFDLVSIAASDALVDMERMVDGSEIANNLRAYDALVLLSLDVGYINDSVAAAIKRFVRETGKGLLVLPSPSSLFERPAAWNRLGEVLPVRGNPPYRFTLQYTHIRPGPDAVSNVITTQLVPRLSQSDWQQRSPLLGYYGPLAPKPGSEVLIETVETGAPACVFQRVGEGRVALVSVGPLWRWKFLSDNDPVYNEFFSRVLDFLSRGDETERFVIKSRKNIYDSGERAVLSAEVFNEKMQPVTGAPVRVEISRVTGDGEVPLEIFPMTREGSDNPRFRTELPPLGPGHYRVRGEADLPGRTLTSEPLDISVSEASVEFQRVHQDRSNLIGIARQAGSGAYLPLADAGSAVERIPLERRFVRSTSELSLRTSAVIFVLIVALLSLEWIIRKRSGMI